MVNTRLSLLILALACAATLPLACQKEPPAMTKSSVTSLAGGVKAPAGFKAKAGTSTEAYTRTGWAKEIVHEGTGIELVFIAAGEFRMGSPLSEQEAVVQEAKRQGFPVGFSEEGPQHEVKITKAFYMGKYELTQGQWQKVMGANPSSFKGDERLPVETVSWRDCREFLRKAGDGLRLPTEAEWEYACRAGTETPFSFGANNADLWEYGNYCDKSNTDNLPWQDKNHDDGHDQTAIVGSFRANAWGLFDMHGNVWEWCQDTYGEDYYTKGEKLDPAGPASGSLRVLRGGSWGYFPPYCRSAYRFRISSNQRDDDFGLRVVVSVDSRP